jgi:nucleoside-diphosphate-sugar epimerase
MTFTVAITGAGGFLGQHLVRHAEASGARVIGIVREEGAADPARGPSTTMLAIDRVLGEPDTLRGVDVLIHAAAIRHRHGTAARSYRASNVELVEHVLRAAGGRVGRFVHVSSVGVYGFPSELPITEATPFAPRTLYSQTKIAAEKLVRPLARSLSLPFTIVRPTIIYGAGDRGGMVDKLAAMLRAGRYRIVGSGENTLHHTHVDDVVDGIFALAASDRAKDDDFIIAGPETTTLNRLSELVAKAIGVRVPRLHVPLVVARAVATAIDLAAYRGISLSGEPPVNHEKLDVMTVPISFDPAKARGAGFLPRIAYVEGIERTLRGAA